MPCYRDDGISVGRSGHLGVQPGSVGAADIHHAACGSGVGTMINAYLLGGGRVAAQSK